MSKLTLNTKIVATIGPSTWDPQVLQAMINNGLQVARINASFADYNEIKRVTKLIRSISPKVTILLDTMGHKIRVTGFEEDRKLKTGDEIIFIPSTEPTTSHQMIQITYNNLADCIKPGSPILLDDGNLSAEVTKIEGDKVFARIIQGGILKKGKTVNTPGTHLHFPELPEKDKNDIKAGLEVGVDMIAASFVRSKEDILKFKEAVNDKTTKIIAKIEDVEGVQNFDEILEVADGIMVARGDLGVEIPIEKVPHLQKEFIQKCREVGKPVIVATQMLESMREHIRPTRAEATDVATAVLEGTDALMLSAETSTGRYPIESVAYMAKIAKEAEQYINLPAVTKNTDASKETDLLCKYASDLIKSIDVKGVIVLSFSGRTARSLARHRLNKPIWVVTSTEKLARQLMLSYGIHALATVPSHLQDRDELIQDLLELGLQERWFSNHDKIVIITGTNVTKEKSRRMLEILDVHKAFKEQ